MSSIVPLGSGSSQELLEAAADAVRAGGVLALPTESFYALGASAFDQAGVRRVCELKGRPADKPMPVLIADRDQLMSLVTAVTATAKVLVEAFWPGPLTLVFEAKPSVPDELTARTGSIGVRQIALPNVLSLLRRVGPLTGTSANPSDADPPRTAQEVQAYFGEKVSLILDGGQTSGGPPSTIVDTRGPARLLREGPISREQVNAVLTAAGFPLLRT